MQQRSITSQISTLSELLGTYSQLSARFAPPTYALKTVATAYGEVDEQPTSKSIAKHADSATDSDTVHSEILSPDS